MGAKVTLQSYEFDIAKKGYATSFPESSTPAGYCAAMKNLYINSEGDAEAREGLSIHSTIDTALTITQLHEFIDAFGVPFLFASGGGRIFRNGVTANAWTEAFIFPSAVSTSPTIRSYSMNDRIVFYDGVHRSVYTTDGIAFNEQRSVLEAGRATIGTTANFLMDSTVLNFTTTQVTQYDLVRYTALSAVGLVTSVVAGQVNHTPVSATATGIGKTNAGEPGAGSVYIVEDMIELNIVPIAGQDPDNMGVLAAGSTASIVVLSAVPDFTKTIVRTGDIVYNVTRNRVTEVTAVATANLGVVGIVAAAVGDEIVLLKSSMPITRAAHVHFSRSYLADAREPHKIRISGPGNSQDFGGTGASTLDVSTFQPAGEVIKSLHSFQRFFTIGGTKNIYFFEGTVPAAGLDEVADFGILGSFPIGVLSIGALSNAGNEVVFVTNTGIQSATLQKSTGQMVKTLASFQLDRTLRSLLALAPESEIIMFHYPRRSWLCTKLSTELYVYNYATALVGKASLDVASAVGGGGAASVDPERIAWHLFDGPLAQQKCYLVRQNGDLLTGDIQGRVNIFDQGVYTDRGSLIEFNYTDRWQNFGTIESRVLPKISRKSGKAIMPFFESGAKIPVTVAVDAGFNKISSDTVVVTADTGGGVIGVGVIGTGVIGGSNVVNKKTPLRWTGPEAQFSFTGAVSAGPLRFTGYVVYFSTHAED